MLRITAKVDYAVRALAELARHDGRPVTAIAMSTSQRIPRRFLAVTLGDLRRARLIESRRGGDGGYWLAEPAEDITISRVFEAIDGSVVGVWDTAGEPTPSSWLWALTEQNLQAFFDDVTIAEVARRADAQSASTSDASTHDGTRRESVHLSERVELLDEPLAE